MDKKIKSYITGAFIAVVLLIVVLFIKDSNYSDSSGLSYEEKKKDAKYLVQLLEEVYPFYEIERKEGNIPSKSKIIKTLSKTKTDKDFFYAMLNTVDNIKNGIVDMYPNQLNQGDLVLLDEQWGIEKTNFMVKSYEGQKMWLKYFQELFQPNEYIIPEVYISYFEGDYYIRATKNPNVYPGDKIVKIQGTAIDEYIKKNLNNKYHGNYYKFYDSKREKEIALGDLFQLSDKDSKIKISVIGKDSVEKQVEVGADDPNKLLLYTDNMGEDKYYVDNRKGFLNVLEQGKVVAINFSMEEQSYNEEVKENIYNAIDNSEYLILDTRNSSGGILFEEIISYISPGEIKFNRYNVMKKNKYNDQVMQNLETQYSAIFEEKYNFNNDIINEKFPASQYHRLKIQEAIFNGLGKYKGKVFIFSGIEDTMPMNNALLRMLKENDIATFISNNNIEAGEDNYLSFTPQAILPNSNMIITLQNSLVVDDEGKIMVKEYFKPDYLIEGNKELYVSQLSGEISPLYYENFRKYTGEDEYYTKFLEDITKN
ncbi:hypothetical protein [Clostridium sp.]|uniref:hypothetical protein n=1 Tax=Clostridium sp. TaxID=1506 RepID=UPI002FC7E48F